MDLVEIIPPGVFTTSGGVLDRIKRGGIGGGLSRRKSQSGGLSSAMSSSIFLSRM